MFYILLLDNHHTIQCISILIRDFTLTFMEIILLYIEYIFPTSLINFSIKLDYCMGRCLGDLMEWILLRDMALQEVVNEPLLNDLSALVILR